MTAATGTITNAGLVILAKQIGNVDTPAAFGYIAVGTGATAAAVTDTQMGAEKTTNGFARAAATPSYVASYTARFVKVFTSEADGEVVREIGLFNAASGPTMGYRGVLAADKTVDTDETCTVTIDIVNAVGA